MTGIIFSTDGEEYFRIPPPFSHNHYVGTKCPETKLEIKKMTKIPLKAITITYTRTLTFTPTRDIFEAEPDQESFESYALCELFDTIYEDVSRDGDPMPYTDIQQGETVEIDWEDEE